MGRPDNMHLAPMRKFTALFLALRDFAPEERQEAIEWAMEQLAEHEAAAKPDEPESGGPPR